MQSYYLHCTNSAYLVRGSVGDDKLWLEVELLQLQDEDGGEEIVKQEGRPSHLANN